MVSWMRQKTSLTHGVSKRSFCILFGTQLSCISAHNFRVQRGKKWSANLMEKNILVQQKKNQQTTQELGHIVLYIYNNI